MRASLDTNVIIHFKDDELVARGVEMEAYSVEDNGENLCFHVLFNRE